MTEIAVFLAVQQDLQQCTEDGFKQYKVLMDSLLEPKEPMTDTQLVQYHKTTLETIKKAMETAYVDLLQINDTVIHQQVENLLSEAKAKLDILTNQQLNVYLRKHEIQIESILKKVKGFTNQAEMFYDEKMEPFQAELLLHGKSRREGRIAHEKLAKETVTMFEKLLTENNFETHHFWKNELEQRLKEQLDDLLEKCSLKEIEDKPVASARPRKSERYRPYNVKRKGRRDGLH